MSLGPVVNPAAQQALMQFMVGQQQMPIGSPPSAPASTQPKPFSRASQMDMAESGFKQGFNPWGATGKPVSGFEHAMGIPQLMQMFGKKPTLHTPQAASLGAPPPIDWSSLMQQ